MSIQFTGSEEITSGVEQQVDDYLLSLVTGINYQIIHAAQADGFECQVEVEPFTAGGKTPNIIYAVVEIFRDRGFKVTYDGSYSSNIGVAGGVFLVDHTGSGIILTPYSGNLIVSWSYPNMTYAAARLVHYPRQQSISNLGSDFAAGTLYLYQTEGSDLRQFTPIICAREIEREIRRVAEFGGNILTYSGPNNAFYRVPDGTLASLYSELLVALFSAGYDAEFKSGILVIVWNSFRMLAFDGGRANIDLTLSILPAPPLVYAYVHTQTALSTTWIIDHNLGFLPSVELTNSFGIEFEAEVINVTVNRTIVQMNVPLSGFARLT